MSFVSFPAVRACIFDMDGLLINSEDVITRCVNTLLEKYERPPITRNIRVQLMGVPDSTSSDLFLDWAKLPIDHEQFTRELDEEMHRQFTTCEPLPGAEKLLSNLSRARCCSTGESLKLAMASSTRTSTYQLKSSRPETKQLLSFFASDRLILGDDPRVGKGRGKPAPDIYLVALESLRAAAGSDSGEKEIQSDECLVFEDSIAGVESARRAGMRVIWVPHPDVLAEWEGKHKDVLAGTTGTSQLADEWHPGEMDDGQAETISSLEHFDYEKFDIQVPA